MTKEELKKRTKKFALDIIILVDELPDKKAGRTIGSQLIRSGTSVAANYRSVCRSRSNADFISRITVVEEEFDESQFWLEIISESALKKSDFVDKLITEASELTAIFTASGRTAKLNNPKTSK